MTDTDLPEGGMESPLDIATARDMAAEEMLAEHLREIRRIGNLEKELKKAKEAHVAIVVPLIKQFGTRVLQDPVTGKPVTASVVEAETLVVDAGQLLEALIEQEQGDIHCADVIWKDVLKPPAVDTKEEGLFHQAATPVVAGDPSTARIKAETVAKVARWKKSKAFISFGSKTSD